MSGKSKRSLVSSEDELLLARPAKDHDHSQNFVEIKRDSRTGSLLGVVLSISGILLLTLLVVLLNMRSRDTQSETHQPGIDHLFSRREPISLTEVLTGELMGPSFEVVWLTDKSDPGQDELLFSHSGDLYLASVGNRSGNAKRNPNELENLEPQEQVGQETTVTTSDLINYLPNVRIPLASNPKLASINYETWKLSPSRRFLLLAVDQRQRFRSSFTANYFVYDTKLDWLHQLRTQAKTDNALGSRDYFGEQLESPSERPVRFQVAEWFSQPNDVESLLLVQDGDLYVLDNIARRLNGCSPPSEDCAPWWPKRLTFTGKPGTIYNGITDWSYEENLTGGKPAYAISPGGGHHLAYFSFNDSHVSEIPMILLDDNTATTDNVRLRFPTAGTPIASVQVHIIENFADATRARHVPIELPVELTRRQHFLFYANWLTLNKLSLVWLNRVQSEKHVLICNRQVAPSGADPDAGWICERSSSAKAPSNGWLETKRPPVKLNDDFYLIETSKFEDTQVGMFTHIARVSLERPNELMFLTSGHKEVEKIAGVDLERSLIYYSATGLDKPGESHFYVASLRLPNKLGQTNYELDACLTCDLYPNEHLYYEVELSKTARHFILKCNGPGVPRIELRELLVGVDNQPKDKTGQQRTVTSRLVRTIENNQQVRARVMQVKAMPIEVRLNVPIRNTDYNAHVLLLLPPLAGFEQESIGKNIEQADGAQQIRRYIERMRALDREQGVPGARSPPYPMIVDVYGGPAPAVKTGLQYNVTWGHWHASSRRTVYAWIEGRGSALEGTNRLFELFRRLGTVEIEDQIQVTRDLVHGHLAPLVDPARVGIWGWSYGGYAAGMVLARDGAQSKQVSPPGPGVFACGASFGGVTSWLYYDTLFSEMILGSPWKNERYDRHTLGDHLLPSEFVDANNNSIYLANQRARPLVNLRDDTNDRYRNSSLIEQAHNIRGKRYMLVSGLADDNVHIQNMLRLSKRLVAEAIPFEMAFYPNQRHSMNYNQATREHMHNRLADFFARCFRTK